MTFLGYIISSEGIMVDLEKFVAMKRCPRPMTLSYIRIFLGLAGYYR